MALVVLGSLVGTGNCDFDSVDTAPANAPRLTINDSGVATAILHEHPSGQAQGTFDALASQNDVNAASAYTSVTGNTALAWGIVAAGQLAKLPITLGSSHRQYIFGTGTSVSHNACMTRYSRSTM